MAVKVGNSWVSEAAYTYAKENTEASKEGESMLSYLKEKFPNIQFSSNTAPFSAKGTNNIAIAPNILKQMENDPEKRIEYEALIYDCVNTQKSLSGAFAMGNSELIAHGFIINSDGTLGAWGISRSINSNEKNPFRCKLPKNNKKSWISRLLESSNSKKKSKLGMKIMKTEKSERRNKLDIKM